MVDEKYLILSDELIIQKDKTFYENNYDIIS